MRNVRGKSRLGWGTWVRSSSVYRSAVQPLGRTEDREPKRSRSVARGLHFGWLVGRFLPGVLPASAGESMCSACLSIGPGSAFSRLKRALPWQKRQHTGGVERPRATARDLWVRGLLCGRVAGQTEAGQRRERTQVPPLRRLSPALCASLPVTRRPSQDEPCRAQRLAPPARRGRGQGAGDARISTAHPKPRAAPDPAAQPAADL